MVLISALLRSKVNLIIMLSLLRGHIVNLQLYPVRMLFFNKQLIIQENASDLLQKFYCHLAMFHNNISNYLPVCPDFTKRERPG